MPARFLRAEDSQGASRNIWEAAQQEESVNFLGLCSEVRVVRLVFSSAAFP